MRSYPSKLLLFGEHVLLLGNTALAVPLPCYSGKWVENGNKPVAALHQKLMRFAESEHLHQVEDLDAVAFYEDLQNGLGFESNIPIGYGLGSSGALCAAVYDRYCRNKTADLTTLKAEFAKMESFFHGMSSGIDPLTSYLTKPILIQQKTLVSIVEMPSWQKPPGIFLIDSALPRQTGPLVRWFLDKCEQAEFAAKLQQDYLPAHEAMVRSWLAADADAFWANLQRISRFQLENFEPMIPATLRDLWVKTIENQEIIFKICGAGGGGFMLGFSKTDRPLLALSEKFNLVIPFTALP